MGTCIRILTRANFFLYHISLGGFHWNIVGLQSQTTPIILRNIHGDWLSTMQLQNHLIERHHQHSHRVDSELILARVCAFWWGIEASMNSLNLLRRPFPVAARLAVLRFNSTFAGSGLASSAYVGQQSSTLATNETPSDLTRPERKTLEAALRVDQAGEVAANYIYMGQMAVLGKDPKVGGLIQVRHSVITLRSQTYELN